MHLVDSEERANDKRLRRVRSEERRPALWLRFGFPLALSFLLVPAGARADLVILKDGFVLYGKIRHEKSYFADPISKQVFFTDKLDGFYMVDDNARRVIFSAGQVADATHQDFTRAEDAIRLEKVPHFRGGTPMPIFWKVDEVTTFDKHWQRHITLDVKTRNHPLKIGQKLTELTPHHARVDAFEYNWIACYLTSELGPDEVRTLVRRHLDRPGQKVKLTEADKQFRVFRFLLQAGYQKEAEKELKDLIESDIPKDKKQIAESWQILKKLQALKLADAIELASKVGQPRETRRLLNQLHRLKIDADMIGEKRLTAVQAIEEKLTRAEADFQLAQRYLKELPDRVADTDHKKIFAEAAAIIHDDLRLDNLSRLEGFLGLAKQEERYRKHGKGGGQNPAELLAMAISGWLLGNDAAEAAPDTAIKLWEARGFVLKYQNTANDRRREEMRSAVHAPRVGLDELAQMIRFLPPPDPEQKINTLVKEMKVAGGQGPTYYLKLPPEYHHQRSYPVLILLHGGGEDAKIQLARWSEPAAQNGYILAAPTWNKAGLDTTYDYSPEEHNKVTDVLRDLSRHVQIDSDRVFLFGFDEGANMAYDVGLSHPDLFAGVVTMGGKPRWHAYHYWPNAQYLPFYVIDGSADGLNPKYNRDVFKQWVGRGYPCLYVEYQGRGPEWLSGELPHIFDWMEPKKRAHPRTDLGSKKPYQSMRRTDNRFYWLSFDPDFMKDGCVNEPGSGWKTPPTPALIEGNVGSSNYIYVSTRGLRKITVWLAPATIDFEKPVTIRVNGTIAWNNKRIPPSLQTLMDDLYERGDRQRLFLAKKDFVLK
jgi:predicted esterase